MKEIGGYFGTDSIVNNGGEFYCDLIALNSARNALVYVMKAKRIKKIYIPYFICDCIPLVCEREGFSYEYYHTDKSLRPVFNKTLGQDEFLYIVNFYGQLDNSEIISLKEKYERIIVDNVQSFFQEPVNSVDTLYTCRKFFGVPDGAYLSTDTLLNENLPVDDSSERAGHLDGRIKDGASAHFAEFRKNDDSLDILPLMQMSELTHKMLGRLDYEKIKQIREENFSYLHGKLKESNKLELRLPDGPFSYPYYCENGLEIKKKLAEKKIYVPTLWPNVLCYGDCLEKDYAANILPLPCDQRYGIKDMQKILEELTYFAD